MRYSKLSKILKKEISIENIYRTEKLDKLRNTANRPVSTSELRRKTSDLISRGNAFTVLLSVAALTIALSLSDKPWRDGTEASVDYMTSGLLAWLFLWLILFSLAHTALKSQRLPRSVVLFRFAVGFVALMGLLIWAFEFRLT